MIARREATAALKTPAVPPAAEVLRDPPKNVGRGKKKTIAVNEASHVPIGNQVQEREMRVVGHPAQRVQRKRTPAAKADPDLAATMTVKGHAQVRVEVNGPRAQVGVIAIVAVLPGHPALTKAKQRGRKADQAQANRAAAAHGQKSLGRGRAATNAHFQKGTQRHVDLFAGVSEAIGSAFRTRPMKDLFG